MKKVLYKRKVDFKERTKELSLSSRTEDAQSVTQVQKGFLYTVTPVQEAKEVPSQPEISIFKEFDTKKRIEKFKFEVKGFFYLDHGRSLVKVDFKHKLDIYIKWKTKNFSPKKSAVLTK
jgi:hypothetical protein